MGVREEAPRAAGGAAASPKVAAIVLNYNGREVTLEALASLSRMDYEPFDLIVVDNGSTDGSYPAVAAAFPGVVQLRTEENLGPAGGCNLGIRYALARDYDYLLILNNDIEVDPAMLGELVRAAEADPTIGCVGPKGYYFWERERIWSAGGELRFREAVTHERGQGEVDRGQHDRDRETDYVNGCAMLVRRRAVEAAGLWDPIFQLCVEDADFCLRVRGAGYRCFYAHRARLWHMVSSSTGGYKPGRTFHTGRSTAIFLRRWAGPWGWVKAVAAILASLPAAYLRELARGNQAAVVAKARGFWEGFFRVPMTPPPAAPSGPREAANGSDGPGAAGGAGAEHPAGAPASAGAGGRGADRPTAGGADAR